MKTASVRLAVLTIALHATAASAGEATTPTYRSPADMSVEERTEIMTLVGAYNSCVYKEGMARVKQYADIRQTADVAMAACEGAINTLGQKIESFRFEPGFGEQFVHHTQSRAVRTLLPELAIQKSAN